VESDHDGDQEKQAKNQAANYTGANVNSESGKGPANRRLARNPLPTVPPPTARTRHIRGNPLLAVPLKPTIRAELERRDLWTRSYGQWLPTCAIPP
jgi:hypothetical protein